MGGVPPEKSDDVITTDKKTNLTTYKFIDADTRRALKFNTTEIGG